MDNLLAALPLRHVASYAWLPGQSSQSPLSTLCGHCALTLTSECKFWGTTVAVVIVLGIVLALLRNQVTAWISTQVGRHTLIVAGLFVVVVFGAHLVGAEGYRESCAWSKTLDPNLEDTAGATEQLNITVKLSDGTQQRLHEQYREIRGRARHHLMVMAYFFTNYYRAIQMMALFGAIAAVALFFVAFKGWTSTNQYVRNVFITATVFTAYFSLYPAVFKQQDNITDNKNLYLEYVAIQGSLRTFAATGQFFGADGAVKSNDVDFLHDIDQRMATLDNIAIGFDYTKVSYKDIFSTTQPKPTKSLSQEQGFGANEAGRKRKTDQK